MDKWNPILWNNTCPSNLFVVDDDALDSKKSDQKWQDVFCYMKFNGFTVQSETDGR